MGQRDAFYFIDTFHVPFGGGREGVDVLATETKKLEGIYEQKIDALEELKKSVLSKAFGGEV